MTNFELKFPHLAPTVESAQELADELKTLLSLKSARVSQDSIILVTNHGTQVSCDEDVRNVLRHRLQGRVVFCPALPSDTSDRKGTAIIQYDTDRDFDPADPDPERYLHLLRDATVASIPDDQSRGTEVIGICSAPTTFSERYHDGVCLTGRTKDSTRANSKIM
jgi:hypothetical protein